MAAYCLAPLFGKMLRVTALDLCGNPPENATPDSAVVTKGFTTLTLSSQVEDATEILVKRADGSLCVNERTNAAFKRFDVAITFCGVDPSLLSIVSNAKAYRDWNGDIAGITVSEGNIEKWFALELWTGLSGQACEVGASFQGGYVLLPFVTAGVPGDFTVDAENAVNFALTGAGTKGGNGWGAGPYRVVLDDEGDPAGLPTPLDPLDHLLLTRTSLAPPDDFCGLVPMTPYVIEVEDETGPAAGGNVVELLGVGLSQLTAVKFAANAGTALTIEGDTRAKVTVPAGTAGTVDVTVTIDGNDYVLGGAYTYV